MGKKQTQKNTKISNMNRINSKWGGVMKQWISILIIIRETRSQLTTASPSKNTHRQGIFSLNRMCSHKYKIAIWLGWGKERSCNKMVGSNLWHALRIKEHYNRIRTYQVNKSTRAARILISTGICNNTPQLWRLIKCPHNNLVKTCHELQALIKSYLIWSLPCPQCNKAKECLALMANVFNYHNNCSSHHSKICRQWCRAQVAGLPCSTWQVFSR